MTDRTASPLGGIIVLSFSILCHNHRSRSALDVAVVVIVLLSEDRGFFFGRGMDQRMIVCRSIVLQWVKAET